MSQLSHLPNIGKTLATKLEEAGILCASDLIEAGSEKALFKIAALENSAPCLNMLFALEGAIQGIRWHGLSNERKDELKAFYNMLNIS